MRNVLRASPLLSSLLLLIGCDQRQTQPDFKAANHEDPVVQDIKQTEYEVRLAAANKRIDDLERKVGALADTPEKLDLDLLTQRVAALEVKAIDPAATTADGATTGDRRRPTGAEPVKANEAVKKPASAPKQNSSKSEPRARLATPAEAKAFFLGK